MCFFNPHWMVSFRLKLVSNSKANDLIWEWPSEIHQFGVLTEPLIYAQSLPQGFFTSSVLPLAFYETWKTLSYPALYCLFVSSLYFLPNHTEISQGPSFICDFVIVPFVASHLKWYSVDFFLIGALRERFDIWAVPKHFRKTQREGEKNHFVSRYTYSGFHCVPESSSKHSQFLFRK